MSVLPGEFHRLRRTFGLGGQRDQLDHPDAIRTSRSFDRLTATTAGESTSLFSSSCWRALLIEVGLRRLVFYALAENSDSPLHWASSRPEPEHTVCTPGGQRGVAAGRRSVR